MITKFFTRKRIQPFESIYQGDSIEEDICIQAYQYDKTGHSLIETMNYSEPEKLDDFINSFQGKSNIWLNIHGIHKPEIVTAICRKLDIHQLSIQDIFDTSQRPKSQKFDTHFFLSLKSHIPDSHSYIESEQISFILSNNFLISIQEKKSDHFEHIRERITQNIGQVNGKKHDYLLFLLIESILDDYYKLITNISNELEESSITDYNSDPSPLVLQKIEHLRRSSQYLKRSILPIKEFVLKVEREKNSFISQKNNKYFAELKDICFSLLDECDKVEFRCESGVNLFFSIQGFRMNQVMKTLTVVSSIFIPLTFIAGIYGMNFVNMPELHWKYGYHFIWILMLISIAFMIYFFKKKKWF